MLKRTALPVVNCLSSPLRGVVLEAFKNCWKIPDLAIEEWPGIWAAAVKGSNASFSELSCIHGYNSIQYLYNFYILDTIVSILVFADDVYTTR
jgi:hypothetical protein